jgi:hypothetical protein
VAKVRQGAVALLKAHKDGLTKNQMRAELGCSRQTIDKEVDALALYCVYIDRYVACRGPRQYEAVYILVDRPDDCPKPAPNKLKT